MTTTTPDPTRATEGAGLLTAAELRQQLLSVDDARVSGALIGAVSKGYRGIAVDALDHLAAIERRLAAAEGVADTLLAHIPRQTAESERALTDAIAAYGRARAGLPAASTATPTGDEGGRE